MSKKYLILLTIFSLVTLILITTPVIAQAETPEEVNIYFFWGDGCPYCEEEKPFLDSLLEKYPQTKLIDYEVWYNTNNQDILQQFSDALGFEPRGVPVTIIGDQYWIGFREEFQAEIDAALQNCLEGFCEIDVGSLVSSQPMEMSPINESNNEINTPLIGLIDLDKHSLAISTAIIGFVDGFNICSLWVLSILLTITLHSGSRTKVLVVGLTFLIVSAIVYSLFIAGVFTLLSYIGYLKWIQIGVALITVIVGIINMKDYFWYKEGVSFTISDKHKPRMYQNMRNAVVNPRTIIALIGSSAALAVGVSFIEFSCTAGFPVIWSNLMVANQVNLTNFILLLALYMIIYFIDELVIFLIAVYGMRASRIEEKHGRLLKLISGVIMLFLGLVMVFNPELMNSINSSLLIFVFALLTIWITYFIHQKILPKHGIYIGTGLKNEKK